MWRSILAVVLLPSLAAAQNPDRGAPAATHSEPQQASPTNSSRAPGRTTGPTYQTYTFQDAIRRGRREEVAISLSPQGLVTSPKSPVSGIVPLKLELQPADGLTFSAFRYPKTQRRKVKFQAEPVPVLWWPQTFSKSAPIRRQLWASTLFRAKLTFQVIDYNLSRVGPVQEMDVQIPDHSGGTRCESAEGNLARKPPFRWTDHSDHCAVAGGDPSRTSDPCGVRCESTQLSGLGLRAGRNGGTTLRTTSPAADLPPRGAGDDSLQSRPARSATPAPSEAQKFAACSSAGRRVHQKSLGRGLGQVGGHQSFENFAIFKSQPHPQSLRPGTRGKRLPSQRLRVAKLAHEINALDLLQVDGNYSPRGIEHFHLALVHDLRRRHVARDRVPVHLADDHFLVRRRHKGSCQGSGTRARGRS